MTSTAPAAMTAAPSSTAPATAPTLSAPASTPSSSSAQNTATGAKAPTATGVSTPSNPSGGAPDPKSSASDAAAAEAKVKEEVRKHKLKVNGKDVEFDEPEVIRRAQLAEAANQKFQEAAEMRKQAADLLEAIKKNPAAVMNRLGLNPREFAEKFLSGELQREMMTPEQRELEDLRSFKQQQEAARQAAETEAAERTRQTEFTKLQQRAAAEYDSKITEALTTSNLPKTAETVKRVAGLLLNAAQKGYELDPQTAVDMVRQSYMSEIQAMFGGLKGEALLKMLGDGIAKEIRQHDLARIKAKLNPPTENNTSPAAVAEKTSKAQRAEKAKHLSPDDWFEEVRRKAGV